MRTNCNNEVDENNLGFKINDISLCSKCLEEIQFIKNLKKQNRHKRK
jgi:hypothetical protein